jgi:hypothetical protein
LEEIEALNSGVMEARGIAIQCQYCPGQAFRRSRLRIADLTDLFLMRYPVRCLRCSQRQRVSFTIAGISVPSHVKQRRARHTYAKDKLWQEPVKQSLKPISARRADTDAAATAADLEQQEKRYS